ncbi:MAG TPA: SCP2 sterol-binding domain-containing protein [Micromonosporaceae bacterium]
MTSVTDERYESIKKIVESTPSRQLTAALGAYQGGYDAVLDTMFEVYQQRFLPDNAKNASATFAFNVDTPEGLRSYGLVVADGQCRVIRGEVPEPTTTVSVGVDNFVKLSMGKANGLVLTMSRKLKVTGDMKAMMSLREWFENP